MVHTWVPWLAIATPIPFASQGKLGIACHFFLTRLCLLTQCNIWAWCPPSRIPAVIITATVAATVAIAIAVATVGHHCTMLRPCHVDAPVVMRNRGSLQRRLSIWQVQPFPLCHRMSPLLVSTTGRAQSCGQLRISRVMQSPLRTPAEHPQNTRKWRPKSPRRTPKEPSQNTRRTPTKHPQMAAAKPPQNTRRTSRNISQYRCCTPTARTKQTDSQTTDRAGRAHTKGNAQHPPGLP